MRTLRRRWWTLLDDEQGMTLVEVIAAMFILSVALLALAGVGTSTLVQLRQSRDREQATNAASAAIERVRARDFDAIVHGPDASLTDATVVPDAIGDLLDVDDAQCVSSEPLAVGAADEPVEVHQTIDRFDVHLVVTHSADSPPGCEGDATGLKRVVAIASWRDGGDLHHVRQQTLITSVSRGLPVPEFSVDPVDAQVDLFPEISRRCVRHTVRNEGTADGYAWDLVDASARATDGTLTTDDGAWDVTGYLVPGTVAGAGVPEGLEDHRMTSPSGDSTSGPRGDLELSSGETGTLLLCYAPTGAVEGAEWDPQQIMVRSLLDNRVEHELTHTLSLVDTQRLYLLEDDDASAHARCQPADSSDCTIEPMVMRPEDAIELDWVGLEPEPDSEGRLGRADYGDATQSDWSTDVDEPGAAENPGLRLLPASPVDGVGALSRARWRHQLTSTLDPVVLESVTLELYVWQHPPEADAADGEEPELAFDVYLDVLTPSESDPSLLTQLGGLTVADDEPTPGEGWDLVGGTFDLGDAEVAPNSYLQLRVECAAESEVPCDLAYDNTGFPASLWLEAQR